MRVEFSGQNARMAKRRALQYWYNHRDTLGLSLSEFVIRCRLTTDGNATQIVFHAERRTAA